MATIDEVQELRAELALCHLTAQERHRAGPARGELYPGMVERRKPRGLRHSRSLRPGRCDCQRHVDRIRLACAQANAVYPEEYRREIEALIEAWRPEVWARSVAPASADSPASS
jgi:hypothetical protein